VQDILFFYINKCEEVSIALSQYLDKEKGKSQIINHLEHIHDYELTLEEYEEIIRDIIYLELNLHQIDQDMNDLITPSSKKKLHMLVNKTKQVTKGEPLWEEVFNENDYHFLKEMKQRRDNL
jgi:hypothetical protein